MEKREKSQGKDQGSHDEGGGVSLRKARLDPVRQGESRKVSFGGRADAYFLRRSERGVWFSSEEGKGREREAAHCGERESCYAKKRKVGHVRGGGENRSVQGKKLIPGVRTEKDLGACGGKKKESYREWKRGATGAGMKKRSEGARGRGALQRS